MLEELDYQYFITFIFQRMKHLTQVIFVFLIAFTVACGGGKSDKAEETTKKDSSETTEKETPKTGEKEKSKTEVSDKQQVTTGTFVEIEEGDYAHFNFKTESGEEKSLFVLQTDDTYEKISANPKKYKGTKIKVTWETKMQDIPENGGATEIDAYIKSEILK
jgi:hypothetical protein